MLLIMIEVGIIILAVIFITFACVGMSGAKHKKKPVEMKGDLKPEKVSVEEEKEKEKIPSPKKIRNTPDYDTSDAVVLFSGKEKNDGWICRECGTENDTDDSQCMVCGIGRSESERG